jgi:hypothetical protein
MNKYARYLWGLLGVAIGATVIVATMPDKPEWVRSVEERIRSIVTPKAPIGALNPLTPTRDLRGTWKSSLPKKGIQVYGQFTTGPGTTTVHENGDMELIIDDVKNGVATGRVRYTDLCVTAQTAMPKPLPSVTVPKQCTEDSGYDPITIRISGSRLDFGTAEVDGATASMQGNFTTDIISGTATVTIPAYGVLKGEFHLNRE